jgi:hypothetical protein
MGMICYLRKISRDEGTQIDANPNAAYELILGAKIDANLHSNLNRQVEEAIGALKAVEAKYASVAERVREANQKGLPIPEDLNAEFQKFIAEIQDVANSRVAKKKNGKIDTNSKPLGIDKAWHGIHFLLTGRSEGGERPLSLALLGGREVPDRSGVLDYGPAMRLTPEEVQEVARALQEVNADELIGRYSASEMQQHKIYAMGQDAEDDREYLRNYYEKVVAFYVEGASAGMGMLIYLR